MHVKQTCKKCEKIWKKAEKTSQMTRMQVTDKQRIRGIIFFLSSSLVRVLKGSREEGGEEGAGLALVHEPEEVDDEDEDAEGHQAGEEDGNQHDGADDHQEASGEALVVREGGE